MLMYFSHCLNGLFYIMLAFGHEVLNLTEVDCVLKNSNTVLATADV